MTAPPRPDPARARALARSLRDRGFGPEVLRDVLQEDEAGAATRAAALPGELAVIVTAFVLGDPVALPRAEGAFDVENARALGVVEVVGDAVVPTVRIVPHDVILLASDIPVANPRPDHVAAAHLPSLALARLTVRRHVERALDLGTGNGVQALMLALHASHVVATDVNPRALAFTKLNAALNGRSNIETRHASFLEPLGDERYGVVVCSPPYVISPETTLLYRDSPLRGDAVGAHVIRSMFAILEEDGYATVLASWVDDADPLTWVGGCSALAIRLRRESAAESAAYWDGGDDWLAYYAAERIREISYGAVVLHRSLDAPWRESIDLPDGPAGHAGAHLQRLFAANERPAAIAGQRFEWAPGVELSADGIAVAQGLPFRIALDRAARRAAGRAGSGKVVPQESAALIATLVSLGVLVPH